MDPLHLIRAAVDGNRTIRVLKNDTRVDKCFKYRNDIIADGQHPPSYLASMLQTLPNSAIAIKIYIPDLLDINQYF
jgi:hypothetical protein